jgi:hypothetical protein
MNINALAQGKCLIMLVVVHTRLMFRSKKQKSKWSSLSKEGNLFPPVTRSPWGWGCSSVTECMLSMQEALRLWFYLQHSKTKLTKNSPVVSHPGLL